MVPTAISALPPFPDTLPLPGQGLHSGPHCIDLGGHRVERLLTLDEPPLVVLGNLFSTGECAALIDAARPRMARSLTVQQHTGGEEHNAHRTSDGMFFRRGETPLIQRMEERLARLLGWPVENCEGLQVLRYGPGAEYRPHYDYFDPAEPGSSTLLQRGGQRLATLLIYLNTPDEGGATTFPDLRLTVAPLRGNAVFFRYDQPHPASRTLHGGAPVIAGEKWVATQWLRERKFE